jgi:hypothetical protein
MVKGIKFRRGTTSDHSTFTGQEGEITVDITKDVGVVHDGVTAGGFPLVGETTTQRLTNKDINATALKVVGVATASYFVGDGSLLTNVAGGGGNSGYANTAGIATYATSAGISTVAQGLTGTPNITVGAVTASTLAKSGGTSIQFLKADGSVDNNTYLTSYLETDNLNSVTNRGNATSNNISVGIVTASSYYGNGVNISGIVTSLVAGTNVSISSSTGRVTINASSDTAWIVTSVGIHTLSNVGIGTTNPTSTLTVAGSASITGSATINNGISITGITTISNGRIQFGSSDNIRIGNLPAGSGSGRNIAIGDQVLVSLSSGSGRNIGIGELSYYDTTSGQYNIGIGERAGQKITTGAYNVILGAYDGNTGGLDIRTSSNNVVIADGQGNIRQYINSSGNVGIKTTIVTEALTVAGVVSATSFYGTLNANQLTGTLPAIDGSNLYGVVASGTGIIIQSNGTPVGTAGTVNFANYLNVSFSSGIATVSGASSVSVATTAYSLAGSPNVNLGNVTAGITTIQSISSGNKITLNPILSNTILEINNTSTSLYEGSLLRLKNGTGTGFYHANLSAGGYSKYFQIQQLNASDNFVKELAIYDYQSESWEFFAGASGTSQIYINQNGVGIGTTNVTSKLTVVGNANISGVVTASSFSGSGTNLTNLPAGQLTGTLPAIDGSALLNINASGSGIVVLDDNINVGSARTINFGIGLGVTYSSSGIATITASGGSLQSRTTVIGVTTSIANNGIGNTNITGFKSYALMKVGLSTAGWLRIYTDSTSRSNDISRSVGIDPAPGSGVIAEVVTTGITTTQIITPFVMGGNLDDPSSTTIYAAITNLSGSTQPITANLTILQLEA